MLSKGKVNRDKCDSGSKGLTYENLNIVIAISAVQRIYATSPIHAFLLGMFLTVEVNMKILL